MHEPGVPHGLVPYLVIIWTHFHGVDTRHAEDMPGRLFIHSTIPGVVAGARNPPNPPSEVDVITRHDESISISAPHCVS